MHPRNLKAVLVGSACAFALNSAAFAQARNFDVPAGDLGFALDAYIRQSGEQLIYKVADVRGVKTPGVRGDLSSEAALAQLLSGTSLTVRRDPSGLIAVAQVDNGPQSGSAAGDGAEVEALIVTAQKREEDIQDVPIAISAFSQEDLTRSQVAGGPDLMTQVPNMTFTKTNFSSYSIQIRGIGTQAISATTDAAVAVAFNNTPFIRNRFFEQEFYDLQRIEVLRGPQGTLYGRNATAGVVNIISAKPSFAFESKLSADIGNYSSKRLEGMVNVPLVEDVVALRLAGAWTMREGFVTNEITNNPIDGRDLWSTRLSLRFTPTDNIEANLIWEHFNEDDDRLRSGKQLCKKDVVIEIGGVPVEYVGGNGTPQTSFSQGCEAASLYSPDSFQTPNGWSLPYYHPMSAIFLPVQLGLDPYLSVTQSRDLRVIESTVDPHYRAETDVVELQFSIDLPNNLTLASETGYLSDTVFSTQDYNRFNTSPRAFRPLPPTTRRGILDPLGVFCDPQIGCADRLVAVDLSTADSHHFSQEFRLSSDYDGPFNFSLGANFLRYDTEEKYYVFINTLTMFAAIAPFGGGRTLSPYVAGVTDNRECLYQGLVLPDLSRVYNVGGCVYIDPNPIGSLDDLGHNYFLSRNPYKLMSYALFGETYYNIADNLKLTAGFRWTVDKKEAPRIPSWVIAAGQPGANASGAGYSTAEIIEQEWQEPTGRLTLDWKPDLAFTDETLLYASYARGYKAGGANPPPTGLVLYASSGKQEFAERSLEESATHPKDFDPEFVHAFEIGAKNTLLDSSLTLNTAAFYYDYTGYQISQIVDRSALNLNFDAQIWGLEIEADWRPLENLRFGFKGGYENTRVADGSRAIDVMDRTAGRDDWVVLRPFPSLPSNCIVPLYTVVEGGQIHVPSQIEGGGLGGCENAYIMGLDPVTELPYVPDPVVGAGASEFNFGDWEDYPGFDPLDESQGHNRGAGFYKDLSGNELPNAPHFTATITADFTKPLTADWLMTLHTDLYYQSEAWTRIFNMEGYDKLKAYSNVNLAAIFTNEDAGWKVMAYVKNVFDRDSITGAFLNSDDTGLTTNVFLTEPRLYGVRVTKEWSGGPWWTGANPNHPAGEPYPLTVELSGQVQRQDAPYETLSPGILENFSDALDPTVVQHRDLDWGDGRELRVTYQPKGSRWKATAGVRYGRTNTDTTRLHQSEIVGERACLFEYDTPFGQRRCNPDYVLPGFPPEHPNSQPGFLYLSDAFIWPTNWSDASARDREEHAIIDFAVGREVGLGDGLKSTFSLGARAGEFESTTSIAVNGVTDTFLVDGFGFAPSSFHRHEATTLAERRFEGVGPVLSWDAAKTLWGSDEAGHLDVEWSITGGVLFGKQDTSLTGEELSGYWTGAYSNRFRRVLTNVVTTPVDIQRSEEVEVPLLDLSLGLSYEIQRVKVSTGYRWERYFDVLDVGYDEASQGDRTIDGPYFKLAIGFGG